MRECPKCGRFGMWVCTACAGDASGIETEGHDPGEGHGAEHESPTAEGGDAHTLPSTDPGPPGVRS
jgi:hypothetical protein